MGHTESLADLRDRIELITFDCYGTLVDWESGLRAAIKEVSGHDSAALYEAYMEAEVEIESGPYRPYREVQAETLRRIAVRLEFDLPQSAADVLACTLPTWPVWPDTNPALKRLKERYRIGVLSNIDHDLFAHTAGNLAVEIDVLVTAEDVRSYKPAHMHFLRVLADMGGDPETVLHVAQSLFHDCVPATQLGIPNVWINRRNETNETDAQPIAVFEDLSGLADALLA